MEALREKLAQIPGEIRHSAGAGLLLLALSGAAACAGDAEPAAVPVTAIPDTRPEWKAGPAQPSVTAPPGPYDRFAFPELQQDRYMPVREKLEELIDYPASQLAYLVGETCGLYADAIASQRETGIVPEPYYFAGVQWMSRLYTHILEQQPVPEAAPSLMDAVDETCPKLRPDSLRAGG